MIAPAPLPKAKTAVAATIGGDYSDFKVFRILDNVIRLDPDLSAEIKDPADAKPFEEQLIKIARATEDSNIHLYVTNAAEVDKDTAMLPFYKNPKYQNNDYTTNRYRPYQSIPETLARAGLDKNKYRIDFGNDTQMNMKFAVKNFRDLVQPGNTVYHFISGQGFNGASARVANDYDISDFMCKEPGHQAMIGVDENLLIEGDLRKDRVSPVSKLKATVEPYVVGGNDADPATGPKATIYNLYNLYNEDKAKFKSALELLSKKTGLNISTELFEASALLEPTKSTQLTSKIIGQQAQAGDALAQAVIMFTADRVADFMIHLINTENRVSKENPLGLISYSGGLANCFHNEYPQAWNKIETRLKEALGPGAKLMLCKPEAGYDGTIELAKFALDNKPYKTPEQKAEEAQAQPNVFIRFWNWMKSLFGF